MKLYYALDLPQGVTRPPIVVLGHSSGEVTAEVNARFARPLVREGFAVLRFDKRGVGRSGGVYSKAFEHMTVLAGDVVAAVEFIRSDARIDASRIGLLGSSQAGWVIPEAVVRSDAVSYVVLLSGPTVTGQQANYWDEIADDASLTISELETRFLAFHPSGLDVDPRPFLEQMRVPGLWLFGEEDRIIPARISAAILNEIAVRLDKPFTGVVFPNVGHSLQNDYWPTVFDWYRTEIGS